MGKLKKKKPSLFIEPAVSNFQDKIGKKPVADEVTEVDSPQGEAKNAAREFGCYQLFVDVPNSKQTREETSSIQSSYV